MKLLYYLFTGESYGINWELRHTNNVQYVVHLMNST